MEKAEKKRIKWERERESQKKKTVNEKTVKKGPKIYDQNKILSYITIWWFSAGVSNLSLAIIIYLINMIIIFEIFIIIIS